MAAKPPKPPDAFLSYTRFDDEHDRGKITKFCKWLASTVRAVTGVPFDIFRDVEGIGLGEHWPGKLDEMLNEARFFIPIVTPSYFTSAACREELEKFLRAEAERERNDLVLPIYYIECERLENDDLRAADPLAMMIHERQRQDWRELRFKKFKSGDVRRALERLAREIVKARRRITLISMDEFEARLPLADIVSRYVSLTNRGRERLGLCPFHREETPSFIVSEAKGLYHCSSCGQHGNAIDFVMAIEGLDFDQAVTRLVELTGLPTPRRSAPPSRPTEIRGDDGN